ncbi:MAG: peptide methionine sulfoxide reductase MsrB [Porticoccaceae bacterium]
MSDWKTRDEAYWRDRLTPEQFEVCRRKGTERPFTGAYYAEKRSGTYVCACCGTELFSSETKYDSGSGWPSFYRALDDRRIAEETDLSRGMVRTEILCAECGSHLGHVFPDGPAPTGLRYCVNSLSLKLEPDEQA